MDKKGFSESSTNAHIISFPKVIYSKARLFFIRHGRTHDGVGGERFSQQLPMTRLTTKGCEEMNAVADYLIKSGVTKNNLILFYEDDTTRVLESVQILIDRIIGTTPDYQPRATYKLRTTVKGNYGVKRLHENLAVYSDSVRLVEQVRRWVNIYHKSDIAIVFVGHKSNKSAIIDATDNISEDIKISFDIENGGIIERDIDSVTGRYISPKDHEDIFLLTSYNYKSILGFLREITELKTTIDIFLKDKQDPNSGILHNLTIWELQNIINEFFLTHEEYLPRLLDYSNPPIEVRCFCLANLIRLNTYIPLESYYLSGTCMSLSQEEKELILKNIADQLRLQKDTSMSAFAHKNKSYPLVYIFERLFLTRPEFWEDERNLVVEYLGIQTYEILIDRRKRLGEVTQFSDENVKNILKYSVDEEIKTGNFLQRKLFYYYKKPESEIKRLQNMGDGNISKEDEYFKMESAIKSILENPGLPRVILGHVGGGKSIELVQMRNEVVGNQMFEDYCSLFYVAKNFSGIGDFSIIQDGIKTLQGVFPDKRIILFFDGVDELDMGFRNQFLEQLQSLHSDSIRVIMTSRYFGFDPFVNTDFQPIQFCPLSSSDIDSFLISRLKSNGVREGDLDKKLQDIHTFLSGNILHHELKHTPLILYFLTYLCAEDSLKDIHNRASLYNKIIVLLLLEHQDFKERSNSQRWTIEILLDTLSYCAFKSSDNKKIKAEDIEGYLGERLKDNMRIGNKDAIIRSMIDKIFLLYRKEGGEYSFILKSFEEYFLARYFVHQHKKSGEYLFKIEDEFNMIEACHSGTKDWVNWIKLHPIIIFYAETLVNEGDYDQLAYFLSEDGLGKEDDIFGVNFFIGLEILYGLPENVKNLSSIRVIFEKYTMKIDQWGIEDIILRFEAIMQLIQYSGYKDTYLSDKVMELLIQNSLVRYIYSLGTPASIKYFTDQIEILSKKKVDVSYSKTKASEIASRLEAERLKREPAIGVKYLRENQFGNPANLRTSNNTKQPSGNTHPSGQTIQSGSQVKSVYDNSLTSTQIQKEIERAEEYEKSGHIQEAKDIYKNIIASYDEYGILKAREFGARWVNQGVIKEMFILYKFFIQSGNEGGVIDAIEYVKILARAGYLYDVGILYKEFAKSKNQMAINSLLDYAAELVRQEQFPRAAYIYIYLVEYGTEKHIQASIDFMEIIRVRKITTLRLSRNLFAIIRTGNKTAISYALECAERLMKEGSFIESLEIYSNLYKSNIYISQTTSRTF